MFGNIHIHVFSGMRATNSSSTSPNVAVQLPSNVFGKDGVFGHLNVLVARLSDGK